MTGCGSSLHFPGSQGVYVHSFEHTEGTVTIFQDLGTAWDKALVLMEAHSCTPKALPGEVHVRG